MAPHSDEQHRTAFFKPQPEEGSGPYPHRSVIIHLFETTKQRSLCLAEEKMGQSSSNNRVRTPPALPDNISYGKIGTKSVRTAS